MSETATPENAAHESDHSEAFLSLVDMVNPMKNKLNWLLLAIPITLYFEFSHSLQMAFVF